MDQSENLLRSCLSLDVPIGRRAYCLAGISLAVVKYLGDVALIALATGRFWKPTDYLALTHSLFYTDLKDAPSWLLPALGLWTLPLIWVGVTLTLKRALDAGMSPWAALGFFVPYFNYLLMVAFCVLPSSERPATPPETVVRHGRLLSSALLAIGGGVAFGILMTVLAVAFKGP
jgi:uncharacterized membrane protein YhaH (DUF805 family)